MKFQLFLLASARTSTITHAVVASLALVPATAAAVVDRRGHRVPNLLVALALVPAMSAVVVGDDRTKILASLALGATMMALPLLLVHLVAPSAMGFGDVKLAAALGAGIGLLRPQLALPALAVASGLTMLAAAWKRRAAMPFAPGLVIGVGAALALGALEGLRATA